MTPASSGLVSHRDGEVLSSSQLTSLRNICVLLLHLLQCNDGFGEKDTSTLSNTVTTSRVTAAGTNHPLKWNSYIRLIYSSHHIIGGSSFLDVNSCYDCVFFWLSNHVHGQLPSVSHNVFLKAHTTIFQLIKLTVWGLIIHAKHHTCSLSSISLCVKIDKNTFIEQCCARVCCRTSWRLFFVTAAARPVQAA